MEQEVSFIKKISISQLSISDSSDSLISPVWKGPHLTADLQSVKTNVLYYQSESKILREKLLCLFKDYSMESL